jgi:hypothetical protein
VPLEFKLELISGLGPDDPRRRPLERRFYQLQYPDGEYVSFTGILAYSPLSKDGEMDCQINEIEIVERGNAWYDHEGAD